MVQWDVFKTLHEALCVPWDVNSCSCVLCHRVVVLYVTNMWLRSAKWGTARSEIASTVICVLIVAVPEDFFRFAAHLFVVCQICVRTAECCEDVSRK
jgi:hypothetical protein